MNKIPSRLPPPAHRQRGIALIEVLGALAIGAALVMGLSSVMDTSLEDVKGQQAAYHQSQIVAAAQKYIAANSASLQSALPAASSLMAVGVPQLIAGKFLATGTLTKNVYGQTPCLLIRQPDPAGAPGQFDALVVTSGGTPIPSKAIAMIAANAGPGGGYISTADPGNARGSNWSNSTAFYRSTTCAGGSNLSGGSADGGHLASNLFYDGPGQVAADFLYRNAVPGRPELNRMNTPIRMASTALVALGSSCLNSAGVAEAGMAIDSATRGLAVCGAAGVWTSPTQWKNPVASYASLPAAGNSVGDVRMVSGLSRAFTYNGSGWVALAVDQNGDLNVPATMTARNVRTTQNIVADGTIHANQDISTGGSVSADYDVNAAHAVNTVDLYAAHNVVTEGLQVNRWASSPAFSVGINYFVAGAPCHYSEWDPWEGTNHITFPVGTVVMDANYVPLICGADKTMRYANGTYTP
ncbi:shufflon system plasmid conjugative transfer pilus tip adhesin PilV [Herbaspirillum seropedicae]|uniref:shufflon system plasmid conjugative transfer pilus tip adhesin PilV n=1 Tax=Herbaspirillum seropedicae TaxID=964 RepID=UPI003FCD718F